MFTKSFTSLRRYSGHALTMMLFCASFSKAADAQTTPSVAASYAVGLNHPSGFGAIEQTAIDSFGDWLIVDFSNGALYEVPAGSNTAVTLAAPGSIGAGNNPGIAIDSNNNLYLEANWNNCLMMFPYDPAIKSWDGLSTLSPSNATNVICPNAGGGKSPYIFAQYGLTVNAAATAVAYPGYFQPWGIAVDKNNNLVIGNQNGKNFIFTLNVTGSGASAKAGTGQMILDVMKARPNSVAVDHAGNIYFVEDSGGLSGAYMIPAGETDVASDTDASIVRVDPNLPDVTGVANDANGNIYISDGKDGVFFLSTASGAPTAANAIMLTPVPAQGAVSVDLARGILYVPTTQKQSNGEADIAEVYFSSAMLGSTPTAAPTSTPQTISFSFSASATPGSIVIEEAGTATPDFTIASGGTCKAGTAYAADSSCTVNVTLSPHAAGAVSAKLVMLDSSGNVLASMPLSGVGVGSAIQVLPATISTIGSGLKTPTQVAVDAAGNVYIADAGFNAIQMYAKGSSTPVSVGTGLTAPTGVAVDGAGDLFIADSGSVYEIPNGPQNLITSAQTTLKKGLGSNLLLAADNASDLYITDPSNNRVVKLSNVGLSLGAFGQTETDLTGFNTPSAIAVDANDNLYVADGSNLIQVTPTGTQSTLLSTLSGTTGLAVDPSGSVYAAQPGGTLRIPNESGTLNPADETQVAPSVTSPVSVAIDSAQNIYIVDAVAEDVAVVQSSASINFGTLSSASATASSNFTLLNDGNAPLNITGFGGTADYSGSSSDCAGAPIAINGTCSLSVTFSPGPGDQGTLTGQVAVQSDAANSPVGVNATGVGAALAASTTTITVKNGTVNGAPATITVAPTSGTSPTPTGQVTLTVTGNGITPVVLNGTLSNGSVTLTPTNLAAGTYQFAASYQGDRVDGSSTASSSVAIGAGAVAVQQPTMAQVQNLNPYYPYVLSGQSGSDEPYDGSVTQYVQTAYYTVTVVPTDGQPLIGQPVYDSTGTKVIGMNYGSITFQGAPASTCAPIPVQANGTAQFDPSCLTIDTSNSSIPNILSSYTVTPVYSPTGAGDAGAYTNPNYTAFTGAAINYTALRNPMVAISASPDALTVTKGSSVSATLTLTSILGYGIAGSGGLLNNYELPVQLSCDGLPAYATCTFVYPNADPSDPQSVHVGPATGTVLSVQGSAAGPCTVAQGCTGPGTVIMTITTNVPSGVAKLETRPTSEVFFAMLGLGLFGFGFGRKRSVRARIRTLAAVVLCCGIMAGAAGCSTTQLGGNAAQVTPAGTYTVQVTAKQVGSQAISQTPGITYGNTNQMSLPFTMKVTVQ